MIVTSPPMIVAVLGMSGCPGRLIDSVYRDLAVSAPGRGPGLQDLARLAARDSPVSCMSRPADTAVYRYPVSITMSGCR